MDVAQKAEIASWVVAAGLDGMLEPDLLQGFCERLIAAGVPLCRGVIIADTLHPVFEGRLFRWQRDPSDAAPLVEFERVREDDPRFERWRQSPFHTLLEQGQSELRRCLARGEAADYPMIEELRDLGHTDYIALITRFATEGAIGEFDCILSSWSTDAAGGFDDEQVALLYRLVPILALAIKTRSLARIAATLAETYLGRGAGRRVIAGRIERGVAEKLQAVLWFSDLRGFTGITDTATPIFAALGLTNLVNVGATYQSSLFDYLQFLGGTVLASQYPEAGLGRIAQAATAAVDEPGALGLAALGFAGALLLRRRRQAVAA